MLTTTEQTFAAEVSKLPSARPISSSYQWPNAAHTMAARHLADVPLEGAPDIPAATSIVPSSAPRAGQDVSSRFGLRLRELRRERNLTQLRMAREFGIDRSFISDVERGRKSISLPMLEVIALGMKVSLSELLKDL